MSAPKPPCRVCGKNHTKTSAVGAQHAAISAALPAQPVSEAPAIKASWNLSELDGDLVTAADVELLLPCPAASGLVLCPWGGVMAVQMPYRQEVIVSAADVRAWWLHLGRDAHATARALSEDLAWVTSPAAVEATLVAA